MRLTFMDGNGFDFAYSLSKDHRFLFCLVILYYCITAFGILNGLVGIFGTIFAVAANDAFATTDDDDLDAQQEEILFSKLDADNENTALDVEVGGSSNDDLKSNHKLELDSSNVKRRVNFINAMKSDTGASKFALKELYRKELEREKEIDAMEENMKASIDLEMRTSKDEDVDLEMRTSRDEDVAKSNSQDSIPQQTSNTATTTSEQLYTRRNPLRSLVSKYLMRSKHRDGYIVPEARHKDENTDLSSNSLESRNFESIPKFSPSSSPIPTTRRLSSVASLTSITSLSPMKPKRTVGVSIQKAITPMRKKKSSFHLDGSGMFASVAMQAVDARRRHQKARDVDADSASTLDTRISRLEDKINNQNEMICALLNQMEHLNESLQRNQPNVFRNSISLPLRESDEDEEEESVHSVGSVLNLLDSAKIQDF